MSDQKKIIVALDKPNAKQALELASTLDAGLCRVKVGKELFTSSGPLVLESLHALGFEVFLDLKFHDIPNTVAASVRVAADLGVWMVNVHASGGERMMSTASEALTLLPADNKPLLIAVTVLTSMDQAELNQVGVASSVEQQVLLLGKLAMQSGCDGVVCSAQEATAITLELPGLLKITPGIRVAGDDTSDQRRVMTPCKAVTSGADYLVIGRSVTDSADPVATLESINSDLRMTN